MFKNMNIKMKLGFGFGLLIIMVLMIALVAIINTGSLNSTLSKIAYDRWPKTQYMNDITDNINLTARALRNAILFIDEKETQQKELKRIEEADKVINEKLEMFSKASLNEKEKELLKAITDSKAAYLDARSSIVETIQGGKKSEAAKMLITKLRPIQNEGYFKNLDNMGKYQALLMEDSSRDAQKTVVTSRFLIMVLTAVAILLAAVIAFWIIRSITKPMNEAVIATNKVAGGDLTVNLEVKSKDEIGQLSMAVKTMVEKLKTVVADLKSTADNVASASQQLSASSEQMSRGVAEQSNRSSQIAASANEMSQTVVDIAKNAAHIASSATETAKIAKEGETVVDKSVEEVRAIADTVAESAKLIESLGERSKQIGNIINVIKDIADQTNLLALNAAIEAARAGEQGRGFAVVADEVRKLAERTAKATSEIGNMIGNIQSEVDKAVISMEEGKKRVEVGVEFSAQTGDALRKIVSSITGLQSMVQQIATATEEMSTVSEQISGDIETIATVSKETSTTSGQAAQASSDLTRLATNLQGVVGLFKV